VYVFVRVKFFCGVVMVVVLEFEVIRVRLQKVNKLQDPAWQPRSNNRLFSTSHCSAQARFRINALGPANNKFPLVCGSGIC
jgi:hypothetical protein